MIAEIREQIIALTQKVENLSEMILKLNDKLSTLGNQTTPKDELSQEECNFVLPEKISTLLNYTNIEPTLEHKDILSDDMTWDKPHQNHEKEFTSELQIQRLTAQLTAAYNRIASLEEQLLSRRIHS
ncbi:MAG: hypothetical protein ACRCT1_19805 [Microcoleaceae cyanobacterium]|jgi:hypothetical protein